MDKERSESFEEDGKYIIIDINGMYYNDIVFPSFGIDLFVVWLYSCILLGHDTTPGKDKKWRNIMKAITTRSTSIIGLTGSSPKYGIMQPYYKRYSRMNQFYRYYPLTPFFSSFLPSFFLLPL